MRVDPTYKALHLLPLQVALLPGSDIKLTFRLGDVMSCGPADKPVFRTPPMPPSEELLAEWFDQLSVYPKTDVSLPAVRFSGGDRGSGPIQRETRDPLVKAEVARKLWAINPTAVNFRALVVALRRLPHGHPEAIKEIVAGIGSSGNHHCVTAYIALMKILAEKIQIGELDPKNMERLFAACKELGSEEILFTAKLQLVRVLLLGTAASPQLAELPQSLLDNFLKPPTANADADAVFVITRTILERMRAEQDAQSRYYLARALKKLGFDPDPESDPPTA